MSITNSNINYLGVTIILYMIFRSSIVCANDKVNYLNGEIFSSSFLQNSEIYSYNDGNAIDLAEFEKKRLLRESLLKSVTFRNDENKVNEVVDEILECERINDKILLLESFKEKNRKQNINYDEDYYNEHVCGIVPHYQEPAHDHQHREGETPEGAPAGCAFTDPIAKTKLECIGQNLTQVPQLPPKLKQLDFRETDIYQILSRDFKNVTIETIRMIQNNIEFISPLAFVHVKNLNVLSIMGNQLKFLSFDIYSGLTDVVSLSLDSNEISFDVYENCTRREIDDIPLVLPKLVVFSLKGNPLRVIPQQMWAGLRESPVSYLDLSSCFLEYIHNETFTFLPKLKTLYLTENPDLMPQLETAFEGLKNTNLENLSLGKNNLQSFPATILEKMGHALLSLDLSDNHIMSITTIPSALSKLKTLNMANCGIRLISKDAFDGLPNLDKLDLRNNRLLDMPSLRVHTKLTYLNLGFSAMVDSDTGNVNPTFRIPDYAFENLTQLNNLFLEGSPIKTITKKTFAGLKKLSVLNLKNTSLRTLVDESFSGLSKLKNLLLADNPEITDIKSLTFYGLTNLEQLNMERCSIRFPEFQNSEIPTTTGNAIFDQNIKVDDKYNPFSYLPSLKWLELANNNITHIYPRLFQHNWNIITLDFRGNQIESWFTPVLTENYTLRRSNSSSFENENREFHMSNKLTCITEAMIKDMISFKPTVMDLSDNNFFCDQGACALRDIMLCSNLELSPQLDTIIAECKTFQFIRWESMHSYKCISHVTQTYHKILEVTDSICEQNSKIGSNIPDNSGDSKSGISPTIIAVASVVCVTMFLAGLTVVGYKKRAHLKYMWFSVKLNVGKVPRKAKTSIAELIQFEYDIFISYHNSDRDFIQDKFLPEIEQVSKTKDEVISISEDNSIEDKNNKGFRVCLHERDFEVGMPITENIVEAVDHSKKVVILVSKKYLESQWCTFEMNLAYHRLVESRRKSFVVILLEDIPVNLRTKVFNYLLRSRTYLEWPGDSASHQDLQRFWIRLRRSLASHE